MFMKIHSFYYFFLIYNTTNSFIIHKHLEKFFSCERVPTEYMAYKAIEKNNLKINVNYFAIPWAALINRNKLYLIPQIKVKGGCTVCQHVGYEKIIPILKKIGINTLFTPHVNKKYRGITVLPFPHAAINGPDFPISQKNLLFSFIGFNANKIRSVIFKLNKNLENNKNIIIKKRRDWHFFLSKKEQLNNKIEYMETLKNSRFSICPRGFGVSTIRFWESLKSGSIPVLISDKMELPSNFNWNSCIIRVPEKDTIYILDIINKISLQQEILMRKKCLEAYDYFLGNDPSQCIKDFYKKG